MIARTLCAPKSLCLHDRLGPQCSTDLKVTSLEVYLNRCQSYLPQAMLLERTNNAKALCAQVPPSP